MLERLRVHLDQSNLIPQNARVVVGYSGGADSTCLLHLLVRLQLDVIAAHLHHGMRPEGDREQSLCEAFANELEVPFLSGRANVPQMSQDLKIGVEEAGRMARYHFFNQAKQRLEANLIATAHTKSDSVETILFNLARGTGASGLTGIPARRDDIVRPILIFTKTETREYCDHHGFWYHDDPANEDLQFSRARIRHLVVPELQKINPSVEDSILRTAEILEEEDQFLNGAAAAALEKSEQPLNGKLAFLTADSEICFDAVSLAHLPGVLLKRAVRLAFGALGGSLDHSQTVTILESIQNRESGSLTCEGGTVIASWDQDRLHVRQAQPTEPFRYVLTNPGETESEEFGWTFTCSSNPTGAESQYESNSRAALAIEIDSGKVKGNLYFRGLNAGDEIQPLGFSGTRKLSDLLSEAKLTQAARARLPIVCDMLGPIWAPGVCLSERVRKDSTSERLLFLNFGPILK